MELVYNINQKKKRTIIKEKKQMIENKKKYLAEIQYYILHLLTTNIIN